MGLLTHSLTVCAVLAVGFVAATTAAFSQDAQCGPAAQIEQQLTEEHQEQAVARGVLGGGYGVIELWVSAEKRTFTILTRSPIGYICVNAAGSDFETVSSPKPKSGAGT